MIGGAQWSMIARQQTPIRATQFIAILVAAPSTTDTSFHARKFPPARSFITQRDHGIHVCSFARWQPARQQRDRGEQSRREDEDNRVAGFHSKQQRFDDFADAVRGYEPYTQA